MKVLVRQIRGTSGRDSKTIDTLMALGLGRIGKESVHTVNDSVAGMIAKVRHLLKVTEYTEA